MDRLTEPCGPNHFRVCGNKTVYNRKPPRISRVSYALAKLFRFEEDQEHQPVSWILAADQLPNGGEDVLVCTGNGWILIAWYGTNGQSWHITPKGITHDDIIAWMPLPEPYRNQENTP